MNKLFFAFLFTNASLAASAQDILDFKFDSSQEGKSLSTVLTEVENEKSAKFFFLPEWIDPFSLQESYVGKSLGEVLDNLFLGTDLTYISMYPLTVVIVKDPTQASRRRMAIEEATRQQKKIVKYVFGDPDTLNKTTVTVTGRVIDSDSDAPLSRANIQVSNSDDGTTTNERGEYTLALNPGVHVLNFSHVNYESKVVDLVVYADGEISLELEKVPTLLGEVIINDQPEQEVAIKPRGQTQLTMADIKRFPALLGEADLIKQLQMLPGVTTAGEAASGFNVRGGSVDQNLILFDGLPVFNSSHVFGFLSTFNTDAIREASFYRGGIPAKYGGRASSVLDIRSKVGDYKKWNGKAGIGMINGNVMIDGPLQKEKTSMAASFRSTYSNWLVQSIRTDYADLSNSAVSFYDGTLKLTHLKGDHTKVSLTGYASRDAFQLMADSTYQWDNFQLSTTLEHEFSPALNLELIVGRSTYGYRVLNRNHLTASELSYRITTSVLQAGFNYQHHAHRLNFGWQLNHYMFDPGTLKPDSPESNARPITMDKQYSIENAFYFGDEWSAGARVFIEAGIRIPVFISFGPASVHIYADERWPRADQLVDTLYFRRGEAIKTYSGVEPRLSLRWMTSPTTSFKMGYYRMYQFLHLVTNTTAVTPVDIWQPSGYYFKPQRADQISMGYFKDSRDKKYGMSGEIFYKSLRNVLDFKDGAQLVLNEHLETDLIQGKGLSYGVETSFSKHMGRLTGSLNYTYSRAFRQIEGADQDESINGGRRYPTSFDQPHIVNVSWKYNLSSRYFFTGNFSYHTGRPVTIPLSALMMENTTVAYFSDRNQYRIPDFHRIDLALVVEGSNKRNRKVEGTWVFSVYNVYGRKNPYTIFFKSAGTGIPKPYQLSIIGTILPSVSYNLKF